MKVPYVDIAQQFLDIESPVMSAIHNVLTSGKYILSEQVEQFENTFKKYCGSEYAFGVANGTDALVLAMKALNIGEGDEVITPANSWISSTSAIALCGATPVFADIKEDLLINPQEIEKKITNNTKAIMPVHLTGKMADMNSIMIIAKKHNLAVIEDAAQAVGAKYYNASAGSIGDIGCFSLHPLKNLNAAGDAGAIVTSNKVLAEKINLLRQHGLESRNNVQCWGYNSRLDEIQAAIVNCKFSGLSDVLKQRQKNADLYRKLLCEKVNVPKNEDNLKDANHVFIIRCSQRDKLKKFLKQKGISSAIHYPIPIHLQPAAAYLGYKKGDLPITEKSANDILSLPIHQHLTTEQIVYVTEHINDFYRLEKLS